MNNIVYVICVLVFVTCFNSSEQLNNCTVDHYWRPLTGNKVPKDAFIAGIGKNGKPVYVVQIQPLESLWTTPYEYYEGEEIEFAWYLYTKYEKIRQFIKILCVDDINSLEWVTVHKYPDEIKNCCLVEGGYGAYASNPYVYMVRVAKSEVNGVTYVGRAYDYHDWDGAHLGIGTDGFKIKTDYRVLAYGCPNEFPLKPRIENEIEKN